VWSGSLEIHSVNLVHGTDELVDLVFSVSSITTIVVTSGNTLVTSSRGRQLEGPQESVGFSEVRTNGEDFVDQIFNGGDSVSAQLVSNDFVAVDGCSFIAILGETTLVDQFLDGLEVRVTVSDVGLDKLQHLEGGLVELDEGTVVDLSESQQLENLSGLGVKTSNTSDTDDESKLGLFLQVEVSAGLSNTLVVDQLTVFEGVLSGVLGSSGEDGSSLGLAFHNQVLASLLSRNLLFSGGLLSLLDGLGHSLGSGRLGRGSSTRY